MFSDPDFFEDGHTLASYTYNARGLRTTKVTPQGTTVYHYDPAGNLLFETSDTGAPQKSYVWLENQPIAQVDTTQTGDTLTYLHTDHLATPRVGTDETGNVTWRWEGEAFGATLPQEDPDNDGTLTTVNLRFPGQYYDKESGLHYNGYRYMDPAWGRYVTSDPIGLAGGLNTYAYVSNNPLKYVDPFGLAVGDWWDFPANLKRARQIAREEFSKRPISHNDMGDAMRHAEWMRRTTQETNACTAWMAGTGHEIDGLLEGQPWEEALMDLHNNAVGRDAGSNSTPVDQSKLWTLPNNGSNYNPYRGVQ